MIWPTQYLSMHLLRAQRELAGTALPTVAHANSAALPFCSMHSVAMQVLCCHAPGNASMRPSLCNPAEALAGSEDGNLLCGKETQSAAPLFWAGQAGVLMRLDLALQSFSAKVLSGPAGVSSRPAGCAGGHIFHSTALARAGTVTALRGAGHSRPLHQQQQGKAHTARVAARAVKADTSQDSGQARK